MCDILNNQLHQINQPCQSFKSSQAVHNSYRKKEKYFQEIPQIAILYNNIFKKNITPYYSITT